MQKELDKVFDEIDYSIKKQPDKVLRNNKEVQTNFILHSQAMLLFGILKQNSEKSLVKNESMPVITGRVAGQMGTTTNTQEE